MICMYLYMCARTCIYLYMCSNVVWLAVNSHFLIHTFCWSTSYSSHETFCRNTRRFTCARSFNRISVAGEPNAKVEAAYAEYFC